MSDVVDEKRLEGNALFQAHKFPAAIEAYTAAIEAAAAPSAVLLSNRAFAYLKTEQYGAALADATAAIAADPTFTKAYYRRATAHFSLGQFKEALKDYTTVVKVAPSDPNAQAKFKECEKIVTRINFEKAIAVSEKAPEPFETRIANAIKMAPVEASYVGPHLQGAITAQFMADLIEHYKLGKKLHRKYALEILSRVYTLLKSLPSLVDVAVPPGSKITVCGDTHGQFYDVCHLFEINGLPSEANPYLFNGDFVDRGSWSIEVIMTMFGFRLLYPNHFHMTRGNHETINMNTMYGFDGECKAKYNAAMIPLFTEVYNWLPLAHVIGGKVFVVHGGLASQDGVTLDDIRKVDRNCQPPERGIMTDLLWSDPSPIPGRQPSKRGTGCTFGPDITARFLAENGLELLIRSHEVKEEGYELAHDGKCITIFSAPNYCDEIGNKAAFITLESDLKPKFTQFSAAPHPDIKPMAYAAGLRSMLGF